MRDHRVWSLHLGRWGGVQVFLHMFFLLFAALTMYLCWRHSPQESWVGALSILILFVSVLLHELGHHIIAIRLGGEMDQIVVGPLGGFTPPRIPFDPRNEFFAHISGPIINLIICLIGISILSIGQGNHFFTADRQPSVFGLLHPLSPNLFHSSQSLMHGAASSLPGHAKGAIGLELTIWINWMLFLVNVLPAFPFDGGRALCSLILSFSRNVGNRRAVGIVARLAKVIALALLLSIWFLYDANGPNQIVPTWFPLVMLAIFLFFSARVEESQFENEEVDEDFFGYDFSQGYTSLEKSENEKPPAPATAKPNLISSWLQKRRQQRRLARMQKEADEDRRMDEILSRLHETGIDNLSPEDRALLHRVSERFRSRER